MTQQWVDAATIRAARAMGATSALVLSAILVASVWRPDLLFWPPVHRDGERMLLALLLGMPLSLVLALRDPVRNAGVFAVVGLGSGFLAVARLVNAVLDPAEPELWYLSTIGFVAVGIGLVIAYVRLRRPHPIVVQVVVLATIAVPFVLAFYEWAARAAAGG